MDFAPELIGSPGEGVDVGNDFVEALADVGLGVLERSHLRGIDIGGEDGTGALHLAGLVAELHLVVQRFHDAEDKLGREAFGVTLLLLLLLFPGGRRDEFLGPAVERVGPEFGRGDGAAVEIDERILPYRLDT